MSSGKSCAQAGHAYLNSYLNCLKQNPEIAIQYQEFGIGTKICLAANDLDHIHYLYTLAQDSNLPCSLIVDSGHIHPPHFDGSEVVTALGIGPCTRQEIEHITKKLRLLK